MLFFSDGKYRQNAKPGAHFGDIKRQNLSFEHPESPLSKMCSYLSQSFCRKIAVLCMPRGLYTPPCQPSSNLTTACIHIQ